MSDNLTEFNNIVNEIWRSGNKITESGKVYTGILIQQVLTDLKIPPDFNYVKSQSNTQLLFVHRKLPLQEFYWINNRSDKNENIEATFRVTGKTAEIWHPETGIMEQSSYDFSDGRTHVPLHLAPNDAVFVILKKNTIAYILQLKEVILRSTTLIVY